MAANVNRAVPGQYRPRMARSRGHGLYRSVPEEYRADYCRCVGTSYTMVMSHVRMAKARGTKPVYPYGGVDLHDKLTKPNCGMAWWRLWWRDRLAKMPKPA